MKRALCIVHCAIRFIIFESAQFNSKGEHFKGWIIAAFEKFI